MTGKKGWKGKREKAEEEGTELVELTATKTEYGVFYENLLRALEEGAQKYLDGLSTKKSDKTKMMAVKIQRLCKQAIEAKDNGLTALLLAKAAMTVTDLNSPLASHILYAMKDQRAFHPEIFKTAKDLASIELLEGSLGLIGSTYYEEESAARKLIERDLRLITAEQKLTGEEIAKKLEEFQEILKDPSKTVDEDLATETGAPHAVSPSPEKPASPSRKP